jgi:transcriptional regulator with XRE-family HTH domain
MALRHPGVNRAIRAAIGEHPKRGELTRVASQSGVTVATVSRWYHGEASPDPEHWTAIERSLGLSPDSLAEAADHIDQPATTTPAPDRLDGLEEQISSLRAEVARLARVVRQQGEQLVALKDAATAQANERASRRA